MDAAFDRRAFLGFVASALAGQQLADAGNLNLLAMPAVREVKGQDQTGTFQLDVADGICKIIAPSVNYKHVATSLGESIKHVAIEFERLGIFPRSSTLRGLQIEFVLSSSSKGFEYTNLQHGIQEPMKSGSSTFHFDPAKIVVCLEKPDDRPAAIKCIYEAAMAWGMLLALKQHPYASTGHASYGLGGLAEQIARATMKESPKPEAPPLILNKEVQSQQLIARILSTPSFLEDVSLGIGAIENAETLSATVADCKLMALQRLAGKWGTTALPASSHPCQAKLTFLVMTHNFTTDARKKYAEALIKAAQQIHPVSGDFNQSELEDTCKILTGGLDDKIKQQHVTTLKKAGINDRHPTHHTKLLDAVYKAQMSILLEKLPSLTAKARK